jgi:hypothetical protein
LFPPSNFVAARATEKSLVLRIDAGGQRVLLMSESGFTGEQWLLDHPNDLKTSIIVFGGQSDDSARAPDLIRAARPFAVVRGTPGFAVPEGEDRHWAAAALQAGAKPFLQSDTGAVIIDLTPGATRVTGFMTGAQLGNRAVKELSLKR